MGCPVMVMVCTKNSVTMRTRIIYKQGFDWGSYIYKIIPKIRQKLEKNVFRHDVAKYAIIIPLKFVPINIQTPYFRGSAILKPPVSKVPQYSDAPFSYPGPYPGPSPPPPGSDPVLNRFCHSIFRIRSVLVQCER